MIRKILSYFDHPAYDVVWGLMAFVVILSACIAIVMDIYAQMHGKPRLNIDSNLAILAGLPVAHFFGRISRRIKYQPTSTAEPTTDKPTNLAYVPGDDPRFSQS